jgi:hypothetical protein
MVGEGLEPSCCKATYSEYVNGYQFHHPTKTSGSSDKASRFLFPAQSDNFPRIAC